ncbi:MAG: 16S rRNA (guanine(966)-N(2))-methyltransferase RsmD [Candidatus Nomurabacteria bacterium]|jgi:16S rRNA (guanine966-N2)-methyltransferase|nr:16S rRNA (guanine(966)-N(2))-methyltransferase RsmD [Candidatus Nomurabacteria bacterium]
MNQVRIIAGKFGGRLIFTPKNKVTHPMGDREKQAVFNMIKDYLLEANVLDAFAGSGALGLEALSRGADRVTFLENDHKALATIAKNIEKLKVEKETKVLQRLGKDTYDVVFVDPPYDNMQYSMVLRLADMVNVRGIMVLSHPKDNPPPTFVRMAVLEDRAYAGARIKVYQQL